MSNESITTLVAVSCGVFVLAAYVGRSPEQSLADYLETTVFSGTRLQAVEPDPVDVAGFDAFMQRYVAALPVERAAVDHVAIGQQRAEPQTPDTSPAPTEEPA